MSVGANPEEALRGLALGDGAVVNEILKLQADNLTESGLDKKSFMIARLAALISMGAAETSFMININQAIQWDVTPEEITGVLIALAPVIGTARIVASAPAVAAALGVVLEG